jgi:hypothetical protein
MEEFSAACAHWDSLVRKARVSASERELKAALADAADRENGFADSRAQLIRAFAQADRQMRAEQRERGR